MDVRGLYCFFGGGMACDEKGMIKQENYSCGGFSSPRILSQTINSMADVL